MVQVILPALDEERVIPGVLRGLPPGFDAIVVDNGSTDATAAVAAAHGATVVHEPVRGFGAACWAGLQTADAPIVCFMDCDGSFDGSDLTRVADLVRTGDADLALGARRAEADVWPLHARVANHFLARAVNRRTGSALTDLGPMRVARREDLLALGLRDRRFGWPLEMVLRAGEQGWRIVEIGVAYRPRGRSLESDRHDLGFGPRRARHAATAPVRPAPSAEPSPLTLLVIAKSPVPGRVKTRLCPPCTPREAAALAEAALTDTLVTLGDVPARARVLVLDGEPGPWLTGGYDVVPQVGDGLAARLANAFDAVVGPALLVGMDTPQCTGALVERAARTVMQPGVDAVLGPAYDGGWWCIGFRETAPGAFAGVEMSTARTFDQQYARLRELGLHVNLLPALRDVDTINDARAVAWVAPNSRFACTLHALGFGEQAGVA